MYYFEPKLVDHLGKLEAAAVFSTVTSGFSLSSISFDAGCSDAMHAQNSRSMYWRNFKPDNSRARTLLVGVETHILSRDKKKE